jgi:nucleotide-binding universal stress UspA family protein
MRLLVCVDFSPSSERAAEEACRMAQHIGAQIDFVHVAPSEAHAAQAQQALSALEESARAEGLAAGSHLGFGTVIVGILDFIERLEPLAVVVGSHGRSGMMRLLVGSVAESLIRRSPVLVLVVPAKGRLVSLEGHAWKCRACGHVLGREESTSRCAACGADSPQWIAAQAAYAGHGAS